MRKVELRQLHRDVLRLYAGMQEVASHLRCQGRNQRIVKPEHYEKAFATKPRARVMVYPDWLIGLGSLAEEYVRVICHKQRASINEEILTLYGLAQSLGSEGMAHLVNSKRPKQLNRMDSPGFLAKLKEKFATVQKKSSRERR